MRKYVLVGASARSLEMYAIPLVKDYSDVAIIVGIFDINETRARYVRDSSDSNIPVYTDYDLMMKETLPDGVIIATIDKFHHEYIIKSLEYGADAITEKPMTIDIDKCNQILEAEKRSGKKVIVTFNCRFKPNTIKIKELLTKGVIGKILSVNFEWLLDTFHGADYYRRWHRGMENSGGLLVHKSTHHFDLVNWWIDEDPEEVYANGTLRFYGDKQKKRGERCSSCENHKNCDFSFPAHLYPIVDNMYFKAEKEDGYFRDRCIFDDEIDIYDTMSLTAKYSKGTLLTYSLISYSPYEGWKVSITGTEGRLEAIEYQSGNQINHTTNLIKVFKSQGANRQGEVISYEIPKIHGKHDGGDERLREMIFRGGLPDPFRQFAGSLDGAKSISLGICANKSIKIKQPIFINDYLKTPEDKINTIRES